MLTKLGVAYSLILVQRNTSYFEQYTLRIIYLAWVVVVVIFLAVDNEDDGNSFRCGMPFPVSKRWHIEETSEGSKSRYR